MNFTTSPSAEDMEVIAAATLESLPEELVNFCESVAVKVEDFPDEALEAELELEDPYDLLALFRSGKEISPGVEKKTANDDDLLILFRRAILDAWCETGEDLAALIRQVIVEELGRNFEFSEEEIDEMSQRHYQGML